MCVFVLRLCYTCRHTMHICVAICNVDTTPVQNRLKKKYVLETMEIRTTNKWKGDDSTRYNVSNIYLQWNLRMSRNRRNIQWWLQSIFVLSEQLSGLLHTRRFIALNYCTLPIRLLRRSECFSMLRRHKLLEYGEPSLRTQWDVPAADLFCLRLDGDVQMERNERTCR